MLEALAGVVPESASQVVYDEACFFLACVCGKRERERGGGEREEGAKKRGTDVALFLSLFPSYVSLFVCVRERVRKITFHLLGIIVCIQDVSGESGQNHCLLFSSPSSRSFMVYATSLFVKENGERHWP